MVRRWSRLGLRPAARQKPTDNRARTHMEQTEIPAQAQTFMVLMQRARTVRRGRHSHAMDRVLGGGCSGGDALTVLGGAARFDQRLCDDNRTEGDRRFKNHVTGVMTPTQKPRKYGCWMGNTGPADAPDRSGRIAPHSPKTHVTACPPGGRQLESIEPAPGRYVRVS